MMRTAFASQLYKVMMVVVGVSVVSMLFTGSASAQNEAVEQPESTNQFIYTANKGDNLTLLVRKSLQLYAAEQSIELDTATTIAAETCAVQELGAFMIDVDEEVTIPENILSDALDGTADLSQAAKDRWLAYAPIDEQLVDVRPAAAPAYVQESELAPEEDRVSVDDNVNQPLESDNAVEVVREEVLSEDDESAPWYWWGIGGGAVAAMWYVLGGNEVIATRRAKR